MERVGIDHVGIGTDFCQDRPAAFFDWLFSQYGVRPRESVRSPYRTRTTIPLGFETPAEMPALAAELSSRGYSTEDVSAVLGGNFLRLFREVWGE